MATNETVRNKARDLRAPAPGEAFGQAARAALDFCPGPVLPEPVWYEAFRSERLELEREHSPFADWAVRAKGADGILARLWLDALVCQGRMAEARQAPDVCAALLDREAWRGRRRRADRSSVSITA